MTNPVRLPAIAERSLGTRLAVITVVLFLALAGIIAAAPSASANTRSTWSKTTQGIEVGWTHNHAWVIASYAVVIREGAGEVASLFCGAVSDDALGPACRHLATWTVEQLVKGRPRLWNHGIWMALYPQWWGDFYTTRGRY